MTQKLPLSEEYSDALNIYFSVDLWMYDSFFHQAIELPWFSLIPKTIHTGVSCLLWSIDLGSSWRLYSQFFYFGSSRSSMASAQVTHLCGNITNSDLLSSQQEEVREFSELVFRPICIYQIWSHPSACHCACTRSSCMRSLDGHWTHLDIVFVDEHFFCGKLLVLLT